MKPFSLEGRVECGLDEIATGKVCALVAVPSANGWRMGLAIGNESGYIPIPEMWTRAEWDEREAFEEHVEKRNEEWFELDPITAAKIVCSTMRRIPARGA